MRRLATTRRPAYGHVGTRFETEGSPAMLYWLMYICNCIPSLSSKKIRFSCRSWLWNFWCFRLHLGTRARASTRNDSNHRVLFLVGNFVIYSIQCRCRACMASLSTACWWGLCTFDGAYGFDAQWWVTLTLGKGCAFSKSPLAMSWNVSG